MDDDDFFFDTSEDEWIAKETRKEQEAQEKCEHEWEWITQPSSPSGPEEHFKVCKICGMEYPGSYVDL